MFSALPFERASSTAFSIFTVTSSCSIGNSFSYSPYFNLTISFCLGVTFSSIIFTACALSSPDTLIPPIETPEIILLENIVGIAKAVNAINKTIINATVITAIFIVFCLFFIICSIYSSEPLGLLTSLFTFSVFFIFSLHDF